MRYSSLPEYKGEVLLNCLIVFIMPAIPLINESMANSPAKMDKTGSIPLDLGIGITLGVRVYFIILTKYLFAAASTVILNPHSTPILCFTFIT